MHALPCRNNIWLLTSLLGRGYGWGCVQNICCLIGTTLPDLTADGCHTLSQGDASAPLRSSLAGLRLGERGGGYGLDARAFSHADLHSLSAAYSDMNPYASHPDLAGLAVRLLWDRGFLFGPCTCCSHCVSS